MAFIQNAQATCETARVLAAERARFFEKKSRAQQAARKQTRTPQTNDRNDLPFFRENEHVQADAERKLSARQQSTEFMRAVATPVSAASRRRDALKSPTRPLSERVATARATGQNSSRLPSARSARAVPQLGIAAGRTGSRNLASARGGDPLAGAVDLLKEAAPDSPLPQKHPLSSRVMDSARVEKGEVPILTPRGIGRRLWAARTPRAERDAAEYSSYFSSPRFSTPRVLSARQTPRSNWWCLPGPARTPRTPKRPPSPKGPVARV